MEIKLAYAIDQPQLLQPVTVVNHLPEQRWQDILLVRSTFSSLILYYICIACTFIAGDQNQKWQIE